LAATACTFAGFFANPANCFRKIVGLQHLTMSSKAMDGLPRVSSETSTRSHR
jgi:hypothetical protein